jgi:hypothetical protein
MRRNRAELQVITDLAVNASEGQLRSTLFVDEPVLSRDHL